MGHKPHVRLPAARVIRSTGRSRSAVRHHSEAKDYQPRSASLACDIDAPLAQTDCFDITDVSDFETELENKSCVSKAEQVPVVPLTPPTPPTSPITSEEVNEYSTAVSNSDEEEEEEKSAEEEDSVISVKPHVFSCAATNLDSLYNFDYPVVQRVDSEEHDGHEACVASSDDEVTMQHSDTSSPSSLNIDGVSLSDEEKEETEEQVQQPNEYATEGEIPFELSYEEGQKEEEYQVNDHQEECQGQEQNENQETSHQENVDSYEETDADVGDEEVGDEDAGDEDAGDEEAQAEDDQSNSYEYGYDETNFEVQHDPVQDPFHEAALAATHNNNNHDSLANPPSILVTSPSNHDITQRSPCRPPIPPATPSEPSHPVRPTSPLPSHQSHAVPPAVPPPPLNKKPPTRPITAPTSPLPAQSSKKKHKLFGIQIGKYFTYDNNP